MSTPSTTTAYASWLPESNGARFMGLSAIFGAFTSQSYLFNSFMLFALGSIVEIGRRFFQWFYERFRIQYSTTALLQSGDPAYEWVILFLTQENVWRHSRDFQVSSKTSRRKWGINPGSDTQVGNADYVPTYERPQLFRWNGYWVEIKRGETKETYEVETGSRTILSLYLTIYTLDMSILSSLVEEARRRYVEISKPHVTIYTVEDIYQSANFVWSNVKRKFKRPLSSIVLEDGVVESLLKDAQEFINSEGWYLEAGIPHRRGYLLYGPPGTGKSSTIFAIAGELGLEIYSLSLASGFVDDSYLQRAVSSIPKESIFLIEDIDCAFAAEGEDEEDSSSPSSRTSKSKVTMSGLLNVLDGVGSEEGKLFFATTNHIDQLDAALLRPGRIDRKIQYHLAKAHQVRAMFDRFFPKSRFADTRETHSDEKHISGEHSVPAVELARLGEEFTSGVPEDEFSTAALQGYLLSCKASPSDAAAGVRDWVEVERKEVRERLEREEAKKEKRKQDRTQREQNMAPVVHIDGSFLTAALDAKVASTPETPGPTPEPQAASDGTPSAAAESFPEVDTNTQTASPAPSDL